MAGVVYPKPQREYIVHVEGIPFRLPSVSEIIEELGLRPAYVGRRPAQRGTALHEATFYDDHCLLDDENTHAEIVALIRQYRSWKEARSYRPEQWELSIASLPLGYGGTIDRLCRLTLHGAERPVLLDIKTGQKAAWHRIQVGLYWLLLGDDSRIPGLLYLSATGWEEVWLELDDLTATRSALTLWKWLRSAEKKAARFVMSTGTATAGTTG